MAKDPRRKGRPRKPADVFKEAVEAGCQREVSEDATFEERWEARSRLRQKRMAVLFEWLEEKVSDPGERYDIIKKILLATDPDKPQEFLKD